MNKPSLTSCLRLERATLRELTARQLDSVVGGTLADGSDNRAACGVTQKPPSKGASVCPQCDD